MSDIAFFTIIGLCLGSLFVLNAITWPRYQAKIRDAILQVLCHGRELHGIPLRKLVNTCVGRNVSLGAFYIAMAQLEREGRIVGRYDWDYPGIAARGGRPPRLFSEAPR